MARIPVDGQPDIVQFQFSFWPMLAIAGIVCAVFGILFGAPTLRLRGDYLAIVTLGFGEIVPVVARNWDWLTNGAQGLGGIRTPKLFGFDFGFSPYPYYFLGLGLVAAAIFISIRLQDSRVGRAWMAIREDELAAGAMGVNHVHYKLLAFAMGAAVGGLGGVFYVAKLTTATPDMFTFPVSVMVLVMVVLGGMGSIRGVVLAALILAFLQSVVLQELTEYVHALGRLVGSDFLQRVQLITSLELIFGLTLVLMMLFRREGLWPAVRRVSALSREQQAAIPSRVATVRLSWAESGAASLAGGPLLDIAGLTKRFGGVAAADDIQLSVIPRELVSVIGPNGSGKTTLFNLITGLTAPDAGTVRLEGKPISGRPPHEVSMLGVARTFQNVRLFNNLTVLENVLVAEHARLEAGALGAIVRPPRVKAEEARAVESALEVLGLFGNRLLPRLDHPAYGLSYANRRRLEIARALATRPKLLLLDERIYEGEIVSLLGGNASGKSTTMKTVLGLVRPTEGTVTFRGQPIHTLRTAEIVRRGIAPVPEARRVFPKMTVLENLEMGRYTRRHQPGWAAELERVYGLFPVLKERRSQFAGTMSGGEQQMLAIGRALMANPTLLCMDEPSMGLSPGYVEQVFDIIKTINQQGTTIFVVEQNVNMALSIANRGYVLQMGEVVLSGTAQELLESPLIKKAYLGAAAEPRHSLSIGGEGQG